MVASRALRLCLLGVLALGLWSASLLVHSRVADQRLKWYISSAYTKGLAFLAKSQLDAGAFPTYSWLQARCGARRFDLGPAQEIL